VCGEAHGFVTQFSATGTHDAAGVPSLQSPSGPSETSRWLSCWSTLWERR
jgi:hypothetical protein